MIVKNLTKLALVSATSVLMVASAGASTTGTLLLNGTVPALLSIGVSAEAIASNLPLDTTQNQTKVATVNEISNSNTGYQVSISSVNEGSLVHESVASSFINYTLRYDGSTVDLTGDAFTYASAASVNVNRDVDISYTGVDHAQLIQGAYSDTVTFTISAN